MRPSLVLGNGPFVFVFGPESPGPLGPFPLDSDPERAAALFDSFRASDVPLGLRKALEALPEDSRLLAFPPALAAAIGEALRRPVSEPPVEQLRRARSVLPATDAGVERRFFLALGQRRLERALRAPEEMLITLAREDERLERSVGREARAAESFLSVPDSLLEPHLAEWGRARSVLSAHAEALRRTLENEAQRQLPNLSAVVGPRVAARLVAAAGGVAALARMPSARVQLLGSRRRPSPERGPRFGILYRADRLPDVPLGRRGAYARSLAALAAIAARADASTHRDLSAELVARRDRRIEALRRMRG